jgi:hypothetical protein
VSPHVQCISTADRLPPIRTNLPKGSGKTLPKGSGKTLPKGSGKTLPKGSGKTLPKGSGKPLSARYRNGSGDRHEQ